MDLCTGLQTLYWIYFLTSAAGRSSASTVTEGGSVILSCRYSVKEHGPSRVCWGRSCGTMWCHGILAQADSNGVLSKVSDRYRFAGNVAAGQMDLSIREVGQADSGQYCCRVDVEGYFNDLKVMYSLKVIKAEVTAPAETTASLSTTAPTPKPSGPKTAKRNSTRPEQEVLEEDFHPGHSLQVNVPVLSFSLSVLLVLGGFLALMGIKRVVEKRLQKESQPAAGPPSIIHEIHTGKPVQENVYCLEKISGK